MSHEPQDRVLLVVDPQIDFVSGSLAVPHAQEAIDAIVLLTKHYPLVVVSKDWHPDNHCSFEESGGPWPVHCVAGSPGAFVADRRLEALPTVQKGMDPAVEAYSAFDGYIDSNPFASDFMDVEHFADYLTKQTMSLGINTIEIVGLALDYCVKATAFDAKLRGYNVIVNLHGTRGVGIEDSHQAVLEMGHAGIHVGTARMMYPEYLENLKAGRVPILRYG